MLIRESTVKESKVNGEGKGRERERNEGKEMRVRYIR